jgi:phage terminase small subunit
MAKLKRERFIAEYLVDYNATQAAIRAGYSKKTAKSIGQQLLTFPDVKDAIDAKTMSKNEVVVRISDIGKGDIADLLDITTTGYSFKLLVDDGNGNKIVNPKTKLIKKIKQKVTTILGKSENGEDKEIIDTEIELYSALDALGLLGKYHKIFTDKFEVTGKDGNIIIVKYLNDWRNPDDGNDNA